MAHKKSIFVVRNGKKCARQHENCDWNTIKMRELRKKEAKRMKIEMTKTADWTIALA